MEIHHVDYPAFTKLYKPMLSRTGIADTGKILHVLNIPGQNPVDIAASWGDARVYDIVRIKWDSLPPPPDPKKKGRKKQGTKRPASTGAKVSLEAFHWPGLRSVLLLNFP